MSVFVLVVGLVFVMGGVEDRLCSSTPKSWSVSKSKGDDQNGRLINTSVS